mgnify:CR=1 FL=1
MWFDRARFGHLDDDAFEALHHYAKQQDEQKPESKESDEAQSVPVKREKQEKVGTDSVLKLTDFAHLKPSSKAARQTPSIKPIKDPHDGRWVLAVRTAESIRHGKLAADKRLRPEQYDGGSFTVSNVGVFGIRQSWPIINPPQAGILGVGRAEPTPIADDGAIRIANVMKVTLAADHRCIDGAIVCDFMNSLRRYLGQPENLS